MIEKQRFEELIKNKQPFYWKLCNDMRIVKTNEIRNIIKNSYEIYKDDIFEIGEENK